MIMDQDTWWTLVHIGFREEHKKYDFANKVKCRLIVVPILRENFIYIIADGYSLIF